MQTNFFGRILSLLLSFQLVIFQVGTMSVASAETDFTQSTEMSKPICSTKQLYNSKYNICVPRYASGCNDGYVLIGDTTCKSVSLNFSYEVEGGNSQSGTTTTETPRPVCSTKESYNSKYNICVPIYASGCSGNFILVGATTCRSTTSNFSFTVADGASAPATSTAAGTSSSSSGIGTQATPISNASSVAASASAVAGTPSATATPGSTTTNGDFGSLPDEHGDAEHPNTPATGTGVSLNDPNSLLNNPNAKAKAELELSLLTIIAATAGPAVLSSCQPLWPSMIGFAAGSTMLLLSEYQVNKSTKSDLSKNSSALKITAEKIQLAKNEMAQNQISSADQADFFQRAIQNEQAKLKAANKRKSGLENASKLYKLALAAALVEIIWSEIPINPMKTPAVCNAASSLAVALPIGFGVLSLYKGIMSSDRNSLAMAGSTAAIIGIEKVLPVVAGGFLTSLSAAFAHWYTRAAMIASVMILTDKAAGNIGSHISTYKENINTLQQSQTAFLAATAPGTVSIDTTGSEITTPGLATVNLNTDSGEVLALPEDQTKPECVGSVRAGGPVEVSREACNNVIKVPELTLPKGFNNSIVTSGLQASQKFLSAAVKGNNLKANSAFADISKAAALIDTNKDLSKLQSDLKAKGKDFNLGNETNKLNQALGSNIQKALNADKNANSSAIGKNLASLLSGGASGKGGSGSGSAALAGSGSGKGAEGDDASKSSAGNSSSGANGAGSTAAGGGVVVDQDALGGVDLGLNGEGALTSEEEKAALAKIMSDNPNLTEEEARRLAEEERLRRLAAFKGAKDINLDENANLFDILSKRYIKSYSKVLQSKNPVPLSENTSKTVR